MHLSIGVHLHENHQITIDTSMRERTGETYPVMTIREGEQIYPEVVIWPGSFESLRAMRDTIDAYLASLDQPAEVESRFVELPGF